MTSILREETNGPVMARSPTHKRQCEEVTRNQKLLKGILTSFVIDFVNASLRLIV